MKNNSSKDFIANYELNNYKYSDFWAGREYEHGAEVQLLERIIKTHLSDLSHREIVDLGGAYGRLLSVYGEKAKQIILADYSTNELLQGLGNVVQSPLKDKVFFVALNAYKLPFASSSVDSLLSVRVMHHLKEMDLFVADLARVLKPGGKAIIEFANKNHIVAILRHILKLDVIAYLREKVVQVTHRSDAQGMKEGQISLMYNFSYGYFKNIAWQNGLAVEASYSCSFLRSGFLKKLFPLKTLLGIENFLQKYFGWTHITPSIFIVLTKPGIFDITTPSVMSTLVCPTCGETVVNKGNVFVCENNHEFHQSKLGITDLRDPRPEDVDF